MCKFTFQIALFCERFITRIRFWLFNILSVKKKIKEPFNIFYFINYKEFMGCNNMDLNI